MEFVFEKNDKSGRRIYLSKDRWNHITVKHPYIANMIEDLKKALEKPTFIVPHKYADDMRNYYFYYKLEKHYLLVSVKYLNGSGFVATAFITRKFIRR